MSEYSVVGKRLPRLDGVIKATGKAEFSGDILLPRMLYGKILRSPYPHARILNINSSKAKRLPGVKAVITGRDTSEMKYAWFDVRGWIKREVDVKEKGRKADSNYGKFVKKLYLFALEMILFS